MAAITPTKGHQPRTGPATTALAIIAAMRPPSSCTSFTRRVSFLCWLLSVIRRIVPPNLAAGPRWLGRTVALINAARGVSIWAAPAGPLAQPFDTFRRRPRHGHHVFGRLDQRHVQQRGQATASPDLTAGPVGVHRPGLLGVEAEQLQIDVPDVPALGGAGQVEDPGAWEETVLYHPTSRAALEKLLSWGLVDVHRQQHPEGGLYSWWDYRMLAFPKNDGLRLDYILATAPLAARCTSAEIDRQERKGPKPSDHAPVVATLDD
jgi:hypothetical protein